MRGMAAEVHLRPGRSHVMKTGPVKGPPCLSCPYRKDAEPGVFPKTVYLRLAGYDGSLESQRRCSATECMFCIDRPGFLCGGWIAVHPPPGNLAIWTRL